MERRRDFRSIINSVPFTFLVGPNHTKLTIQSGLARHLSRPLDYLMNSGQTRESKHQIAVLEDEDVETFVAFCEYAYSGNYSVPAPGLREDDGVQDSFNNTFQGMFSSGGSPHKSAAEMTHEKPPSEVNNEDNVGGRDEEEVGDRGQPSPAAGQEWQPSTSTEYPPQEPVITPRESVRSRTPSAEPATPRGRRRHRGKSGEQQQVQDPTSKLTPPRTPPGYAKVEPAEYSAVESTERPHVLNTELRTEADQSATQLSDWERSASTFDNGVHGDQKYGYQHQQQIGRSRSRVRPVIDTSFANQEFSPHHEQGTSLWDEFTGIDDPSFRSARPPDPLPGLELPYLIFHAKLYVFATRYLIPDLAHLCLQKLHRDLMYLAFPGPDPEDQYAEEFVLTTTKARMVINLLEYTYTKTTRLEPITPSSATQLRDNELRRLVVHYAACKVRDLAEYCPPTEPIAGSPFYPEKASARGFRALLDTLPELASDLIYRMI
ncbi:hypothetical protein BJY01DRAFT_44056 [Aspergillus pseudoustus]|uniref:BTB domain-containing protein n=1 Tax=Aspergillus pseudoustus TaxID=1810923 RepID=A0ABR4KPS3_9EURO